MSLVKHHIEVNMETIMEKSQEEDRRTYWTKKITKLHAEIEALEDKLALGDDNFHGDVLAVQPTVTKDGDRSVFGEKYAPAKLSKILDLSNEASGLKLGSFSRKLRSSPGELYLYDCLFEGRTTSLNCLVKFVETVKGPGCECGEISLMESEVLMTKGDPESLSDWIIECCEVGDLVMLIHGLVEFTELAKNRRSILRALQRRGKSGHFGSCSFSIDGREDGVMVVGVSPQGVNLFSIKWNIVYFHPRKSMKSTFTVTLHEEDLRYESAEIFDALQRPCVTEDDLPLLWESIGDTLASYS